LPKKILFIDDDAGLQALLAEYFSLKGFDLVGALNGREGLDLLARCRPDIIILDLMLPGIDGFDVLRSIRNISDIPVIMLTALEDETDRIVGLEIGADDYLHKPINPRELLARVKAVMRRAGAREEEIPREVSNAVAPDAFVLDPERRRLRLGGQEIELTQVEFDLLFALIQARGRIVTRDQLMDLARGRDFEAFDRSVDVHISRIRKKVEQNPASPKRIKTIWGKGYRWEGELP
jgi:DNA-binding response OmpR family regulator